MYMDHTYQIYMCVCYYHHKHHYKPLPLGNSLVIGSNKTAFAFLELSQELYNVF